MRKRRPMARALSLLLSLILALSLLPGAALAEGADSTDTGSTKYYYMDDVSEVLELAVRSETTPTAKDYEDYDLDKNGLLTTWDAKKMLDTMPDLTGLALDKDTLTMPVGSKARLNVTYTPDNSYDMRLKWDSSDETVATVQGGVVTAVGEGEAIITAASKADSKVKAECKITVEDTAPTISAKAMQISTKGAGSSEWADLEIENGTLKVIPRTKDSFTKTLGDLCDNNTRYPNAGALLNGKLLLQTSYKAANEVNDIQVQVDPNSFAAPALSKKASYRWYDATSLSNGSLLVVADVTDTTNYFVTADGKEMVLVTVPTGFPALRGIASAGKDSSGAEVLYGVTDDGKLYQLTLTGTGDEYNTYTLSKAKPIGSVPTSKMIQSASLLYDTQSGYLLVSVSYATNLAAGENAGLFYLIDPTNPGCYFDLTPADGAVFTSLYQHTSSFKNGVYLYVDQTPISLTVGNSKDLPKTEAYYYSKDKATGLVTNNKLDDSEVKWGSNDKDIATVNNDKRTITGVAAGHGQIWVSANYDGYSAILPITVRVREDTGLAGATVGALVDTGKGNPSWAVIDLGLDNNGNLTFTEKGKADKNYTAGGYAQGKLWGFYSTSTEKTLYPFNAETFASSGDPFATGENNVVDLTGAPATTVTYTKDGRTLTVTDPASLLYVTSSADGGLLGLLGSNGSINAPYQNNQLLVSDYEGTSSLKLSAITYVGDLTAKQVRDKNGTYLLDKCDDDTPCHVYYALTEDDTTNGATLRQLILVPQVDMKDNTPTLSYTLRGSTIGTVAFTDNTSTTSMDFWTDGNRYGLLVARSKAFEGHSIWYIDLTNYTSSTSGNALSTTELGKLTNVNDSTVNSFSGLYHTENTKLSDTQIYKIAGWIGTSSQSLAEVTLEASLKAVSAEQGASGDAKTVTVDIYSSEPATNGLWALKYDTEKLSGPVVSAENEAILYWSYRHYPKTGIVRIAFAIRGEKGLESDKEDHPLFTVTFTVKESQTANAANDVKITERELNQTLNTGGNTGDNTGGNTGGNSGTVTPSKPETLPFTDVEEGSYCYDAVRWAVEKGVTEGVSETSFAPNDPCTRGQAVTFLWRAAGSPAPESQEMPFTDVAESSPYAKAILWAAENGVTKGVTETTFAPNQPCTRGQIVTFLYRSQGAPAQAGSNPFTDVAEESPYLAGILWAAENGVTKGVTETTFAPNNTCVRGQIVTFLFRLWT